ncbi:hypothetical protein ACFOLJ_00030 [Rugamonas sp. CCM 8940]|uniref:hypothetical protein n=1 Tax=Rugamonas sp. CCM 8940 TaxID=2765359 RepID=UPI00361D08BE
MQAQGGDRDAQDLAFVTGVFSLLDVLLGMPMTEIVAALSLDLDVMAALLERSGPLARCCCWSNTPAPQPGCRRHRAGKLLAGPVAGLPLGHPGEQNL